MNWWIALSAVVILLLVPLCTTIHNVTDSSLGSPKPTQFACNLFTKLTPRYARWAQARVQSGVAAQLGVHDIAGTEWPLFGSVFYLWAVENLQTAWEKDSRILPDEPKTAARTAIDAAAALVFDENHAAWVKKHWGPGYLTHDNVFYRMLRIAAATSHIQLTGENTYRDQLLREAAALAADIDTSPKGLLEDYPGECYPGDVVTAIACIRRAAGVLGLNADAFVGRARRGFLWMHGAPRPMPAEAGIFDSAELDALGLVPYWADAASGISTELSRGCGNSYVSLFAPELWPDAAKDWYARYEKHFWQERLGAAGFREFAQSVPGREWYMDVDSGPVMAGFGIAASAFGIGAARANGRFDHAKPLMAELMLTAWPLPDGTLLLPRLLSSAADAPYLGEAAILYVATVQPAQGVTPVTGGVVPWFVTVMLMFAGVCCLVAVILLARARQRWRMAPAARVPGEKWQCAIWAMLVAGGAACLVTGAFAPGAMALLAAQLLPRTGRR